MKKLFILLLIATLSLFALTGCEGLVPAEGEGEGEGEGETEGVVVDIEDMVELGGKNWISCGSHDITITFPAPVENASAYITFCSGNYGDKTEAVILDGMGDVVLFPNEDKTIWTGSGTFGCMFNGEIGVARPPLCSPCCASYVEISAGECDPDTCISFPVIVDCDLPYAQIKVGIDKDACECGGCAITFESVTSEFTCSETECCGDDCSGFAGWSIAIYDDDPFDECCEVPCEEPIDSCSGTACPIECTTTCDLDAAGGPYYVVVELVDNVGNSVRYYAILTVTGDGKTEDCAVAVEEFCANISASTGLSGCDCTDWSTDPDTDEYIGFCGPWSNCCNLIPVFPGFIGDIVVTLD